MALFSRELNALMSRFVSAGGPQLRRMEAGDLDEVLRIIRLHDSDDARAARVAFSQTRFDDPEAVGMHVVVLDPVERRIVGVSGYYVDDLEARGIYWLGWTYVNPFSRGKGYGKLLMEFVIKTLEHLNARKLYLSTSSLPKYDEAVGFYKRFGFVEEGRLVDFFRAGEHKLIMGRPLGGAGVTPRAPIPAAPRPAPPDDEVTFKF